MGFSTVFSTTALLDTLCTMAHGPRNPALGAELAQQLPRWVVEDGIAAYEEGQLCQVPGTLRDGDWGMRDWDETGMMKNKRKTAWKP